MSQLAPATPFPSPGLRRLQFSRRRIASLTALLVSLFCGFAFFRGVGQPPTYSVLLADQEIPRGAVITADQIVPNTVALPQQLGNAAISADQIGSVVGQRTTERVHTGAPLLTSQLAEAGTQIPGMARVAFPITSEHAGGGQVAVGDSVRVLVTTDRGKPTAKTSAAVDGAAVSGIGYADNGLATGHPQTSDQSPKLAWLEVLVPVETSTAFVQALSPGDIDVVILPPPGR